MDTLISRTPLPQNMSGYRIEHIDDEGWDRAKGKTFRNKDEVIDYLINQMYDIVGDVVEVHKR